MQRLVTPSPGSRARMFQLTCPPVQTHHRRPCDFSPSNQVFEALLTSGGSADSQNSFLRYLIKNLIDQVSPLAVAPQTAKDLIFSTEKHRPEGLSANETLSLSPFHQKAATSTTRALFAFLFLLPGVGIAVHGVERIILPEKQVDMGSLKHGWLKDRLTTRSMTFSRRRKRR